VVEPERLWKLPTAQSVQTEDPVVFEKVPGEQFWQTLEPETLVNLPSGQFAQTEEPVVLEKVPGEQFWQVVEPERLWNFPTGQSVHGSEPVKLKLPGVQSCASAGDAFNVSAIAAIAAPLDNMARTLRVPFLAAFICSSPGSFGLRAPPL